METAPGRVCVGGGGTRRALSSTLCILPVLRLLWYYGRALAACGVVALVLCGDGDVGKRGEDVDVLIVRWEKGEGGDRAWI